MTPVGAGEWSGPKLGRRAWAAALVVFVLAFALWFRPLVLHPGSRVTFGFGDATGTLRDDWSATTQHRNPLTFRLDRLEGAPEGQVLAPAADIWGAGIQSGFVWGLGQVLGFIGAWNLFMFLGFVGSGIAMFALLVRLGCRAGAALFGAYVFSFNPFTFEQAYAGHIAYLQNWVLVVLVAALFRLREKRSMASAALVGAAVALSFYVAAYDGLFAGLIVFVFALVECSRLPVRRARTLGLTLSAFVVSLVALAPVLIMYAHERAVVQTSAVHASSDFYHFAARPLSYVLPSPRNPLFHWLRGVHSTDLIEETLFFGYTTLVLAAAAVVLLQRGNAWLNESVSRRWTLIFFAALAPAAFVMSLPPTYTIGNATIPMPSLVPAAFTSFWRVYARFAVVVGLALAVLAAMALTALAQRRGALWRYLAPAALVVVAFVELLPGNVPALSATARPGWVAWLARAPRGIVATYPVTIYGQPAVELNLADYWYQRIDGQPRFAYVNLGPLAGRTRANSIRLLARDVTKPLTPRVLATEGVRYVVLHDDVYRALGQSPPRVDPAHYRLLTRFPSVRIYSVRAPSVNLTAALKAHHRELARLEGVSKPAKR